MAKKGRTLGLADLHVHSSLSDGLGRIPEILEYVEVHTDLDVIAITDHDTTQGGLIARELAAKRNYRFEVIVGAEISTLNGHLLALFVEDQIPSFRSLPKTIEAVRNQGGICIVPHPLSWLTSSVGKAQLDRVTQGFYSDITLDGLETSNSSLAGRVTRKRTRRLNEQVYQLAETGGSDAHLVEMIGSSLTMFPGSTAGDLRRTLLARSTSSIIVPGKQLPSGDGMKRVLPWRLVRVVLRAIFVQPPRLAIRTVRKVVKAEGKHENSLSIPL